MRRIPPRWRRPVARVWCRLRGGHELAAIHGPMPAMLALCVRCLAFSVEVRPPVQLRCTPRVVADVDGARVLGDGDAVRRALAMVTALVYGNAVEWQELALEALRSPAEHLLALGQLVRLLSELGSPGDDRAAQLRLLAAAVARSM